MKNRNARPSSHPPLHEVTSRYIAYNDSIAKRPGPTVIMTPARLDEEKEWARQELLIACDNLAQGIAERRKRGLADSFDDSIDTFRMGVEEFLRGLAARTPARREDNFRLMREAVEKMKREFGIP